MSTATLPKVETESQFHDFHVHKAHIHIPRIADPKINSCGKKTCCAKCKAKKNRKPDAVLEDVTRFDAKLDGWNGLFKGTLDF